MPDTSTLEISVAAKSDAGLKRGENQDRMSRFYSPFGEVFLVTDGMGGHRGGARAASMVGEGFARHLKALAPDTPAELAIRMAAEKTNAEIVRQSRSGDPETAGMGATLVLAILRGNDAVIAHVGDSRAYLYRHGSLLALTRDHTRGQDKVNAGLLTEDEAWDHPESSILTRAFGHSDPLTIDISAPMSLQTGDQILLCSDGLCGYVRDNVIAEVLAHGFGAKPTADKLVQLANEAGGEDNVTVQMILVGEEHHDRKAAPTELEQTTQANLELPARGWRKRPAILIALGLAAALLAAAAWGGYTLLKRTKSTPASATAPIAKSNKPPGAPNAEKEDREGRGAIQGLQPILVFGDNDNSIKELLKKKLEAAARDLTPAESQAFAKLPLSVIVDMNSQKPPVALAYKVHEAIREKLSGRLVTLRAMYGNEKENAKGGSIVVVNNAPEPGGKPEASGDKEQAVSAKKQKKKKANGTDTTDTSTTHAEPAAAPDQAPPPAPN